MTRAPTHARGGRGQEQPRGGSACALFAPWSVLPGDRHESPDQRSGPPDVLVYTVGARGFEPLTSSASRKRSPPELSAR